MFDAWAEIYSNSAVWRSVILFVHVGGILVAGGCAIAADRMTLLSPPNDPAQLRAIGGVHRIVVGGLAVIAISGALMLAADLHTFLFSRVFWAKMLLVVLLLINGLRLLKAEQAARAGEASGWPRLRGASITSLVLWLSIVFFGAMLANV